MLLARIETPFQQHPSTQQQRYLFKPIETLASRNIVEIGDVDSSVSSSSGCI